MHLVAIHVSPERGAPVEARDEVVVETGAGIVGDRWHGSRHRHVSVQSCDDLRAAAEELGREVSPASTRRNLTLSEGPVPTSPGERLRLGDVVLEVVRLAAPCRVMEESIGPGGRTALRGRGGAVCRVVEGGVLALGQDVVSPPPAPA